MRRGRFWRVGSWALLATLPAWAEEGMRTQLEAEFVAPGTFIEADRIHGERGVGLEAEGNVILRRDERRVRADRIRYEEAQDRLSASGAVELEDAVVGARIAGPHVEYDLTERTGVFEAPRYFFAPANAPASHGEATRLEALEHNRFRLNQATWTTCQAPDPDWYLNAQSIELDFDRGIGQARWAQLRFMDTTLLALPWLDFPLRKERKSGWLVPSFGASTRSGLTLATPYYFNLAPNYDATLTPRLYSRRGLQLGMEYRYLTPSYRGELYGEVLPNDQVRGSTRALGVLRHQQDLGDGWSTAWDLNAVSDRDYFRDLSHQVSLASTVHLLRQGVVRYQAPGWGSSLLLQEYQTLARDTATPYRRLPEWRGWLVPRPFAGGTLTLEATASAFRHPWAGRERLPGFYWQDGERLVLAPTWRRRWSGSWWYVEPQLIAHTSHYALEAPVVAGGRTEITRFVPIAALDVGLAFDRDWNALGRDWVQTLEPRLYLRSAPYRNQSDVPLFDTDRYGFGFAQVFLPNPFAGEDRIADGTSVTLGVTSRLLDAVSGQERIRGSLAQRFFQDLPKVALPNEAPSDRRKSDLLAELVWRPTSRWQAKGFWQYDPDVGKNRRFNALVSFQPQAAKVASLEYRYTRDRFEDVAFSAQWPLAPRWYGVGRIARSLEEDRWTEFLAGAEYNAGCWGLRVVLHRYALEGKRSNTAFFVQLDLLGLGGLGSDPSSLLRRSVPGYGRIGPTGPERGFETGW